jgi:RHS repeat-associated protein
LTQTGTNASTFHINSGNNQLSSTTGALSRTYVYNAAGMTTAFGSDIFSYNDRGRMMGVTVGSTSTSYLYNALGQLIEKITGSSANIYVYDEAGHIIGEYDGSGNLIEETVWLGDTPVATLQPSGSSVAINYVHTDHLNTPKKVTRASDNSLVWRIDQDPFGTSSPSQNPGGLGTFIYNPRFPGQLYMPETGLHYNYFRDYDSQVGRYVESDPFGVAPDVGTYSYAHNAPTMRSDPRGLDDRIKPEDACKLLEQGYNPPNDGCGCQKNVVTDLCSCYTRYPWPWQIKSLSVCVVTAYLTKTSCAGDCTACNAPFGGPLQAAL